MALHYVPHCTRHCRWFASEQLMDETSYATTLPEHVIWPLGALYGHQKKKKEKKEKKMQFAIECNIFSMANNGHWLVGQCRRLDVDEMGDMEREREEPSGDQDGDHGLKGDNSGNCTRGER